jgi:hypothetical protein
VHVLASYVLLLLQISPEKVLYFLECALQRVVSYPEAFAVAGDHEPYTWYT